MLHKHINKIKKLMLRFKRPLFIKNFISYSLLFSIPLIIIGFFSYNDLLNSVIVQNKILYTNTINESIKELDNRMNEIKSIVVQFTQSGEISEIIKTGNLGIKKLKSNITSFNNCRNQLGVAAAYSYLVQHIALHFIEEDFYFSTWGGYNEDNFFKDVVFFLDKKVGNMLLDLEQESYFIPISKVNFRGIVTNMTVYSKKIPPSQNGSDGRILFFIDEDSLTSVLHKDAMMDYGINMLIDTQGTCIHSNSNEFFEDDNIKLQWIKSILDGKILNGQEIEVKNEKYILFLGKSKSYGLQYISLMPKSIMMQNTRQIKIQVIMILSILLLFGLFIAFILSKRNSEQVYDIMNIFFDNKSLETMDLPMSDEYSFLKQNIKTIVSDNIYFKTEIQKAKPILINHVLRKIITGNILSVNEIQNDMDFAGIHFLNKYFLCIMFYKNEKAQINVYIKNKLLDSFLEKNMDVYFVDIDVHRTVLLVNLSNNNIQEVKEQITDCLNKIRNNLIENKIEIIAVSRIVSNLQNLYLSFQDCQEIIENNTNLNNCPLLFYSKEDERNKVFYYIPEYIGKEIMDLLMQGEDTKAFELCVKMVNDSITLDNINVFVIQCMMYNFYSLAYRALKNMNVDYNVVCKFSDFKRVKSVSDMLKGIEAFYSEVCEQIKGQKEIKKRELWNKLVNYIQQNFTNTQLTLTEIARNMNVTPQYLCRYVKDHSGYTLQEYINKIRVDYSKEFLLKGYSIKDAAEKSGFSSELTFRRQFKRYENMTPGEFKVLSNKNVNG